MKIDREKALDDEWQAIISITDDGPVIETEKSPILFKKFVTKSEKGIGVGLYPCSGIIESDGGKIWARNGANGAGAHLLFVASC